METGPDGAGRHALPRRMAVKIGSAVIAPGGDLDPSVVRRLAGDVAALVRSGVGVVVVSSGAVACGFRRLGLERPPERIDDRQAAAAIGQPALMAAWVGAMAGHGLVAAQVLLTADDVERRGRFVNARRTLDRLITAGCVPIVNENDSVAFEELRLGDNDRLASLTAGLAGASLLLILSTAPGLCRGGPGGEVIGRVEDVAEARRHVTADRSATGVGGMSTKLDAAAAARAFGVETVIAAGSEAGVIGRAARGEAVGTRIPAGEASPARKHWIAHAVRVEGTVEVDEGARRAIVERGASLLPRGVTGVRPAGGFAMGAAADVACGGVVFARGLVSYDAEEIELIRGHSSERIAERLGYKACDEVIHRDNMILVDGAGGSNGGGTNGGGT